jgi:hypothetical protein
MSSELLDRLDAVVDELAALPWDRLTDDDVLDVLRRVETVKRRLVPVDHAAIGQVQSRSLAFSHGARSSGALLSQLLRISPGEASGRRGCSARGARSPASRSSRYSRWSRRRRPRGWCRTGTPR